MFLEHTIILFIETQKIICNNLFKRKKNRVDL